MPPKPFKDDYANGGCRIYPEWAEHSREAMERIETMHEALPSLIENSKHLKQLEYINHVLTEIKDKLLAPATNMDRIPIKSAQFVFNVLGAVILGLVVVIAFLLTGENFAWIKGLHR